MTLNKQQQNWPYRASTVVPGSVAWNQDSSRRLTLISKNGSIHVGWVEEPQASPAPTEPIQLELDFNQSTADNKWTTNHNHYSPNSATNNFNSFGEHQHLRKRISWSPGLSRRTQWLRRFSASWMRFGWAWRGSVNLHRDLDESSTAISNRSNRWERTVLTSPDQKWNRPT